MIQQLKASSIPWFRKHGKQITRVVWIILIIFVILITFYQIVANWNEIKYYPWKWNFRYILFGLIAYTFSLLGTAGIWAAIITRLSGMRSTLKHIGLYCITNLAMRLPTPLPFIGARSEAYSTQGVARTTTLTAMSLEIIVTIAAATITSIITLPFSVPGSLDQIDIWIWILLIPLLAFVIRPAWLFQIIKAGYARFNRAYFPADVGAREMFLWVGAFILIWMNGGMIYYFLANSIYPVPFRDILAIINVFAVSGVISWIGQLLFFIPNLAVRQIAVAYLLSLFLPLPVAVAVALLTRLCVMIFEMVWALIFSLVLKRSQAKKVITP